MNPHLTRQLAASRQADLRREGAAVRGHGTGLGAPRWQRLMLRVAELSRTRPRPVRRAPAARRV